MMIADALQLFPFIYLFILQWAVKDGIYTSVLCLFLASAPPDSTALRFKVRAFIFYIPPLLLPQRSQFR